MTGTRPDSLLTRWALVQLGLPVDADTATARRQFCHQLPADSFVPAPWEQQAIRALTGQPVPPFVEAQVLQEEEYRQREDVESFAVQYFDLPPNERRQRWQELLERTSQPAVASRLNHLQQGLDVVVAGGDSITDRLGAQVCELYVLRTGERARARDKFLGSIHVQTDRWDKAAVQLRHRQPHLAALEPILLERLVNWQRNRARRSQRQRAQSSGTTAGAKAGVSPYVLVLMVIIMVRVLGGGCSKGSTPNYRDTWRYQGTPIKVEPYQFPKSAEGSPFTPEDLEQWRKLTREQQSRDRSFAEPPKAVPMPAPSGEPEAPQPKPSVPAEPKPR